MINFILSSRLESILGQVIQEKTDNGKYYGHKEIRNMYYQLKNANRAYLKSFNSLQDKNTEGKEVVNSPKSDSTGSVDKLYYKRAKKTKDLRGLF